PPPPPPPHHQHQYQHHHHLPRHHGHLPDLNRAPCGRPSASSYQNSPVTSSPTRRGQNEQVSGSSFLLAARGRYYPSRDPEHLEYDLPSIGIMKKALSQYEIEVLELILLAHRCQMGVEGVTLLPVNFDETHQLQGLTERFAFHAKGRFFGGEVEVIVEGEPMESTSRGHSEGR
ncbi:hypothetical protein P389DRAFT_170883, partial [Cystobasidium minutum MCA 4210]|uniref:uncharacterized protein n=1 Tax=Cystobasidium minutum MCA 4210 TaxID=1397322 RepID=UPI0034CE0B4C